MTPVSVVVWYPENSDLLAQREAVSGYVRSHGLRVADEHVEHLEPALAACRRSMCALLVSQLGKRIKQVKLLSRMSQEVRWSAVDWDGYTGDELLTYAVIAAEQNRRLCGRLSDIRIGKPGNTGPAVAKVQENNERFADMLIEELGRIRLTGKFSYAEMARELQRRNFPTRRGVKKWRPETLRRMIERYELPRLLGD